MIKKMLNFFRKKEVEVKELPKPKYKIGDKFKSNIDDMLHIVYQVCICSDMEIVYYLKSDFVVPYNEQSIDDVFTNMSDLDLLAEGVKTNIWRQL